MGDAVVTDVSADGRFVVFHSAEQFDAADSNNDLDVFLRDTVLGTTIRVSETSSGGSGNGASQNGRISDDGSKVVFETNASNFAAGDTNGTWDVLLYGRTGPTLDFVSTTVFRLGDGPSRRPDISGNGTVVVFETMATNLTGDPDTNGMTDVLRWELPPGTFFPDIERVSVSWDEQEANGHSLEPSVNANGTSDPIRCS